MTKLRSAFTVENALFRVLGAITIERAAEVTGRDTHYLRSMSDPDSRYRLSVDDAIKLDLEYRSTANCEGMPIYEAYGRLLELAAAERFSDAEKIRSAAADVIREGGEAHVALVCAAAPNATPEARRHAAREVEEAIGALNRTIPLLSPKLPP